MWLGSAKAAADCCVVLGCAAQRSLRDSSETSLKACFHLNSHRYLLKKSHGNGQPQGGYLHQSPEPHISLHRNNIGFLCTLPYSVIYSLDDSCRDCTSLHSHRLPSPPCCQIHFWGNCWHFARLNPFSSHDVDPRTFLNCVFDYFPMANKFSFLRRSVFRYHYIRPLQPPPQQPFCQTNSLPHFLGHRLANHLPYKPGWPPCYMESSNRYCKL
jgi:hypothetical protein